MPLNALCIKAKQQGVDIYVTTLKMSDLRGKYDIAMWTPEKEDGYQRPLRDSRIAQIRHYLLKEVGTFPTSVLANVRGNIQIKTLKKLDGGRELCEMTIPDDSLPLYIIDGQHRVKGLEAAIEEDNRFSDYPLIVSMFTFSDPYDEMTQFHIVNSRAKSVPTDLAQRHIHEMGKKIGLPEVMAREGERNALASYILPVVDKLAGDPDSIWYQRVQLPHQKRKIKGQLIKQRPLADSIYFIVKDKRALVRDLDQLVTLLKNYWAAISEIFPKAFADPANYTLQKTPGTYSLNMVFTDVYDKCTEANDLSKDSMKKVLAKMFEKASEKIDAEINDDFWNRQVGVGHFLAQATSQKMIRSLAQYFRDSVFEV